MRELSSGRICSTTTSQALSRRSSETTKTGRIFPISRPVFEWRFPTQISPRRIISTTWDRNRSSSCSAAMSPRDLRQQMFVPISPILIWPSCRGRKSRPSPMPPSSLPKSLDLFLRNRNWALEPFRTRLPVCKKTLTKGSLKSDKEWGETTPDTRKGKGLS